MKPRRSSARSWQWVVVTATRTAAVHVSVGSPWWFLPSIGQTSSAGLPQWRAGWLLRAVQLVTHPWRTVRTIDQTTASRGTP